MKPRPIPCAQARALRPCLRWLVASAAALAGTQVCAADEPAPAAAAAASAASAPAPLDTRVQALKAELLRLNGELSLLEQDLLFPPGTQLAIYLSLDAARLPAGFELESVRVRVDDTPVASHVYSAAEWQALQRGGVQRLHLGNLRSGKHVLLAQFNARGLPERGYQRSLKLEIDKGSTPRLVELKIRDKDGRQQPEFEAQVGP